MYATLAYFSKSQWKDQGSRDGQEDWERRDSGKAREGQKVKRCDDVEPFWHSTWQP